MSIGPNEREDLDALMASPGWLRLLDYAREQWTAGYPAKIKMAIKDATAHGHNVAEAVQRIDAANDEVNAILSWPKQRVSMLTHREEMHTTHGTFAGPDIRKLSRGGQ